MQIVTIACSNVTFFLTEGAIVTHICSQTLFLISENQNDDFSYFFLKLSKLIVHSQKTMKTSDKLIGSYSQVANECCYCDSSFQDGLQSQ